MSVSVLASIVPANGSSGTLGIFGPNNIWCESGLMKLKIACLVESDPEIRNFLLSRSLEPLFHTHDVTLLLPQKGYRRIAFDVESLNLPIPIRRVTIPEERRSLWRRSFHFSQMRLTLDRQWFNLWIAWWGLIGWKAAVLYTVGNLPGLRTLVHRRYEAKLRAVPATELSATLLELAPDIIIHPSTFGGYFINDVIAEGKALGIPTMLLMNSWDNPSTKRATSGKADWVAVWGEQTLRHTHFYMGIPKDRIVCLGAAQFEAYRPKPRITPGEFRSEYGLSPKIKIILYAGSSRGTNEAKHLAWLEAAIEGGRFGNVAVVYRPHPWGFGQQQAMDIVNSGWKHIHVEQSMQTFIRDIADGKRSGSFLMAEYARTHDILSSVDMLLSPLSTMIVEGALHGIPVMCFYAKEEEKGSIWKKTLKNLAHFEDIFRSPSVVVCTDYENFLPSVDELCRRAGDPEFCERITKEMSFFAVFHKKSYGDGLLEHMDRIFPALEDST
jgi:hypothetical protein